MVIDQDFPKINELWIEGVLELEGNNPSLSFTLSATHIVILVCSYYVIDSLNSRKFGNV